MSDPILSAQHLVFSHQPERDFIRDLSLDIPKGQMTALVGPNGCGKSTLLSLLAGIENPQSGRIHLKGLGLKEYRHRDRALILGLLPQAPEVSAGLLVSELLELGRVPHRSFMEPWREEDQKAVDGAAQAAGVDGMLASLVETLSGGQRQRAFIAMALAQSPEVLLLDEPTSALDIAQQLAILGLLRKRVHENDLTVVVAIHDIAQAAQFADHMIVMQEGRIVDQGPPSEIVTPQLFESVFDVSVRIISDETTGYLAIVPQGDFNVRT